jgi:molecular chaperone DnaK
VFQTEKQIKDYGDKLPADKKEAIEKAAADLKTAHQAQDMEAIDKHMETLNNAWTAASQDLYQAQQTAGGTEGSADNGSTASNDEGAEDVTDVEFEEVEDK